MLASKLVTQSQAGLTSLEKEREVYLRELSQKQSQETALLAERRSIITGQMNQLFQRRAEIEARLASLQERLRTAERRVVSSQLLSPVDGIVDQLEVFTIGAVAKGGEQLLRVVPADQEVEIVAVFTNSDIGFVEIGQPVNISLDPFPSERFGFLSGTVSDVAADSTERTDAVWTYEVRIYPETNTLVYGLDRFPVRPGMTATVDIATEDRRLIGYFFAPIIASIQGALGER